MNGDISVASFDDLLNSAHLVRDQFERLNRGIVIDYDSLVNLAVVEAAPGGKDAVERKTWALLRQAARQEHKYVLLTTAEPGDDGKEDSDRRYSANPDSGRRSVNPQVGPGGWVLEGRGLNLRPAPETELLDPEIVKAIAAESEVRPQCSPADPNHQRSLIKCAISREAQELEAVAGRAMAEERLGIVGPKLPTPQMLNKPTVQDTRQQIYLNFKTRGIKAARSRLEFLGKSESAQRDELKTLTRHSDPMVYASELEALVIKTRSVVEPFGLSDLELKALCCIEGLDLTEEQSMKLLGRRGRSIAAALRRALVKIKSK